MKKYLFIVPSLSKGGAEKVVSILSNNLIKKGREVVIITHFSTNQDYYVDKNIKVICLSNLMEKEYRKKISILYLIKLLFQLRKTIHKEKPDYILPFLATTCIRTSIALTLSKYKRKIIHTVRNNPEIYPQNKLLKLYRNYLINKSCKTIVQNNEQKKYFGLKNAKKIFILNNPVDSKIFDIQRKKESNNIEIIGVGRLEPQKNFLLLINAFNRAYKKIPNTNIKLSIYGDGSLKEQLQSEIKKLNLTNQVCLKGRKNDYSQIYGNADIFVLSSNAEGMPNALLEAMGAGLSCISTDCPTGPKDIIANNIDGIITPVGDDEKLALEIERLVINEELRKKISINAKNKILSNYTEEKICNKLINICEQNQEQ